MQPYLTTPAFSPEATVIWSAAVLFLYVCVALPLALHSLMHTRSTQGAIAWIICLLTIPIITVPLYLVGEAKGVKIGGGVLEQTLRTIDIDCLPTDIPEKFDVDVTALGLDQTMFVRDLKLGDKYTVVTRGELAVAVVKAPDEVPAAGAAAAPAADAAAATPEVIKKGKEEDAAAGDAKAADAKKEEKK